MHNYQHILCALCHLLFLFDSFKHPSISYLSDRSEEPSETRYFRWLTEYVWFVRTEICVHFLSAEKIYQPDVLCLQDDKEKKRLELLERKKENQRLLDEENARLKGKAQREAGAGGKVTRAQIEEALQNEQEQQQQLKPKGKVQVEDVDTCVKVRRWFWGSNP